MTTLFARAALTLAALSIAGLAMGCAVEGADGTEEATGVDEKEQPNVARSQGSEEGTVQTDMMKQGNPTGVPGGNGGTTSKPQPPCPSGYVYSPSAGLCESEFGLNPPLYPITCGGGCWSYHVVF